MSKNSNFIPFLVVSPKNKIKAKIPLEIADTPEKRALGMRKYKTPPKDFGMFFNKAGVFWMKNVPFFLELVFINKYGQIKERYIMPPNTKMIFYPKSKDVVAAIELPLFWCKKHNIKINDRFVVENKEV